MFSQGRIHVLDKHFNTTRTKWQLLLNLPHDKVATCGHLDLKLSSSVILATSQVLSTPHAQDGAGLG